MKVYIVLEYLNNHCTVDKIYFNKTDAEKHKERLVSNVDPDEWYSVHIIKKKVNGQIKCSWKDIKLSFEPLRSK